MIHLPHSVLELAAVNQGFDAKTAIENSMRVAELVDQKGFKRIWFAEHHNMPHIASSATVLLIQLAATRTKNIRVGSGGIMLPNHSPLVVAEQFGTLETLFPGRIDLGLGRAPGTDQLTANALRRDHIKNAMNFPNELLELQNYFQPKNPEQKVNAYPGKGLNVPFYILGSSTSSAMLAAEKGLPYAFATHFAPAQFAAAVEIYKNEFRPSEQLKEPHIIACVNAMLADTDEEAQYLSTSFFNMVIELVSGQLRQGLKKPGKIHELIHHPEVEAAVNNFTACTFVGNKKTVETNLKSFVSDVPVDELMFTTYIYDIDAKLKSFELLAEVFGR
ncbi:MAG: LLM class flavin-dependent oxidoreductase [Weeksellaceae bacterium]